VLVVDNLVDDQMPHWPAITYVKLSLVWYHATGTMATCTYECKRSSMNKVVDDLRPTTYVKLSLVWY